MYRQSLSRGSASLVPVLPHCFFVLGPRHVLLRPPVPNYHQILHTQGLIVLVLVHAKLPRQNSTCTLHPRGRVTSCTHYNFARHQPSRAPLGRAHSDAMARTAGSAPAPRLCASMPSPARLGSPAFRASRLYSPARSRATTCPPASRFPAELPLAARLRAPLALAPRARSCSMPPSPASARFASSCACRVRCCAEPSTRPLAPHPSRCRRSIFRSPRGWAALTLLWSCTRRLLGAGHLVPSCLAPVHLLQHTRHLRVHSLRPRHALPLALRLGPAEPPLAPEPAPSAARAPARDRSPGA
jgi:hypothetical protein